MQEGSIPTQYVNAHLDTTQHWYVTNLALKDCVEKMEKKGAGLQDLRLLGLFLPFFFCLRDGQGAEIYDPY